MSWQSIGSGGGDTNPYETVIATEDYTASNEEFVVSDGADVTLPEPVADSIVGISATGKVSVSTPTGEIENVGDSATISDTNSQYFVSDGSNWYLISNRENFPAIPDSYPVLQALDRESQIEAQLEDDE